jgi:hypothetical protein
MSKLYVVATGLVGFATGVLVGLSKSPVVATILPLLFGLVAGVGGLFVSNQNNTRQPGAKRINFIAACVISFIVFNLIGMGFSFGYSDWTWSLIWQQFLDSLS